LTAVVFPAKSYVGDCFTVEADVFVDGHDKIDAAFLIRRADQAEWREAPMAYFDNDRWRGFMMLEENARHVFTVIAWRDVFCDLA
jgi:starch synthase (maltosyl-transferring)